MLLTLSSHGWNAGVPVSTEVLTTSSTLHSPSATIEREFAVKVNLLRELAKCSSIITSLKGEMGCWAFIHSLSQGFEHMRDGCEDS